MRAGAANDHGVCLPENFLLTDCRGLGLEPLGGGIREPQGRPWPSLNRRAAIRAKLVRDNRMKTSLCRRSI